MSLDEMFALADSLNSVIKVSNLAVSEAKAGEEVARNAYLPAMWEIWVRFLSWEDPLKREMATHSSILAWRIPWTEEPSGLQSIRSQKVGHNRT